MDFHELDANLIYDRARPRTAFRLLIESVVERGGWLIFYTHDVSATPSPYGCTPEDLRAVVEAAADSPAQILTIGEALGVLAPV